MVDKKVVKSWLNKADEDLAFARASLKDGLEFYPQICFYLHQSVEKYLKAYIISERLNFPKIHDLLQLVQICMEDDKDFDKFYETAEVLNPFYIGTRYPDVIITVNKSDAEKALQVAEEIANSIKSKLSI